MAYLAERKTSGQTKASNDLNNARYAAERRAWQIREHKCWTMVYGP